MHCDVGRGVKFLSVSHIGRVGSPAAGRHRRYRAVAIPWAGQRRQPRGPHGLERLPRGAAGRGPASPRLRWRPVLRRRRVRVPRLYDEHDSWRCRALSNVECTSGGNAIQIGAVIVGGPSGWNTNTSSVDVVTGGLSSVVGLPDGLVPVLRFSTSLRGDRACATMQGCGVRLRVRRFLRDWTASVRRCSRSRSMPTWNRAGVAAPG